jgi:GT2 family glycosyltransferase
MLAAFAVSPDIGIVGGLGYDHSGVLCHAGGTIDARGQAFHERDWSGERVRDVDFATGASLALSRLAVERCGGFDERFCPGYYEDVDLCYRVRATGLRVVVASEVRFVHLEHSRLGDGSTGFARHFHRNRLTFALEHFHGWRRDAFLTDELAYIDELRGTDHPLFAALSDVLLESAAAERLPERRYD